MVHPDGSLHRFLPLLNRLIICSWHTQHENILLLLQRLADATSVRYLYMALFVPLCLLLLADDRPEQEHDSKVRWLVLVLAVLIVYGNVYMMATDQEAMRQGRESLRVMSDRIVDDLMDLGYFDEGSQPTVMIVGRPSSNPSFLKTPLYTSANKYAQMGRFWLAPECAALSWQGVFEQITPVNITFCSYDQYVELLSTEDIEALPLYPQKGYIRQAGDVVLVKISEDYRVLED